MTLETFSVEILDIFYIGFSPEIDSKLGFFENSHTASRRFVMTWGHL